MKRGVPYFGKYPYNGELNLNVDLFVGLLLKLMIYNEGNIGVPYYKGLIPYNER